MREIKLRWAEKRELTDNARDSREMRETWQSWTTDGWQLAELAWDKAQGEA